MKQGERHTIDIKAGRGHEKRRARVNLGESRSIAIMATKDGTLEDSGASIVALVDGFSKFWKRIHEVGKEASDPRPLGTSIEFFDCFTRLEDSVLSAMLCVVILVCLHEVGKEASDPRPFGRGIHLLLSFIILEDFGLSAMLCGGLGMCLHDVGKKASDLRPLGDKH